MLNDALTTQKRLIDVLTPQAMHATVADVRIGLGYCAVALDGTHAGVAWTPKSEPGCCTHLKRAGTLAGRPAADVLAMLGDAQSALARAVGLATANALLASLAQPETAEEDVLSLLEVTADDRVAMVGYFAPLVSELRRKSCKLDIIELNSNHADALSPEEGRKALASCTVAIITGTSLINGTLDEVLAEVGQPRAAVLLGPSSPLCGEAFTGTRLTHIGGARVRDVNGVLRVVSEGGGTPLLKPYLSFQTLRLGA